MCGLFGIVAKAGEALDLHDARSAREILTHRGPDQAGEWTGGSVYMGHRRLSILDLSELGRQPMVGAEGQVAITVNGEIYNFRGLRSELEAEGAVFASTSDSEVALFGYLHWGLDRLLERIDGMYALAIADMRRGEVYLARDRAGVKPLYHSGWQSMFAWASEPAPILRLRKGQPPGLDPTALHDFLTYRYIPAPKTAWQGVHKLPPACVLTCRIETGDITIRRYWEVPVGDAPVDEDVAAEELRALISRSVAEQRVSDVPLGLFLSGGVDSAIVAVEASDDSEPLKAFTIGFGLDDLDETPRAAAVARMCGAEHVVGIVDLRSDQALEQWMLRLFEEPFADDSALPTWHVSKHARSQVTVALSGDGGDELFGGYRWYREIYKQERLVRLLAHTPRMLRRGTSRRRATLERGIAAVVADETPLSLLNALYISRTDPEVRERWRQTLEIPDDYDDMWLFRAAWRPELGRRKALQYLDFHTFLPEDVLTKVDRASMAHSLEARVPYLSRDLIEFAFGLPESFIYRGGELKGGLKYAYRDRLPSDVLTGPKRGFGLPVRKGANRLWNGHASLQEAIADAFWEPSSRLARSTG